MSKLSASPDELPLENPGKNPSRNPIRSPYRSPSNDLPDEAHSILPNSRMRNSILETSEGFHRGPIPKRKGYVLIAFSWTAAMMDAVFLLGIGMIFLAGFLFSTHFALNSVLRADQNLMLELGVVVFVGLSFVYVIMLRSILGHTLGEWACSLRLGSPRERQSKYYSLRVILRTLMVFATGILPLPVLGLLLGMDLTGRLSGLHLTSLK